MAKTRQENLDGFFKDFDTKMDRLDGMINSLVGGVGTLTAALTKDADEKKKERAQEKADIKKERENKKKQDIQDKKEGLSDSLSRAIDNVDSFGSGISKVFNATGASVEQFKKDIEETFKDLDPTSPEFDIGKKVLDNVEGIFQNIDNIGTEDYVKFNQKAAADKRKQLEDSGASDEQLSIYDRGVASAQSADNLLEKMETANDYAMKVGKSITSEIGKLPIIGGFLEKRMNEALGGIGDSLKRNLISNIFMAKTGTKGLKAGFWSSIPPIKIMGIEIGIATAGVTLLIGLLVAAAAALIGLAQKAKAFSAEANIGFMQSVKIQGELLKADAMLIGTGKSASDIAKTMIEEYGTLANVNANSIRQIGHLSTRFGVATDDLIKFQKGFTDVTGASADVANDVVRAVGEMASGAGVAAGRVIKDLATNMEEFARFSNEGATGMAKAAIEAAKVGANLKTILTAADSLLKFESSITAEFEAQVLTGRNLNLERARAAALQGDMATLTAEIQQQIGGLGNLQSMNVVQKDAIAAALGISVSELTKIARGEAINNEESPELTEQKKTNQILIEGFKGNKSALEDLRKDSKNTTGGGLYGDFL